MAKVIDVTGLNPKQIAMTEEIVTALKIASKIEQVKEQPEKKSEANEEQLKKLHEEFSWLIADLGVKEPFEKSKIYDIE